MNNNDPHISWATVCHVFKIPADAHYHPSEIAYWTNKFLLWQDELEQKP